MYTYIYMYYITCIIYLYPKTTERSSSKNPFNLHQPPVFTYRARFVLQRPPPGEIPRRMGECFFQRGDDIFSFLFRKTIPPRKKKKSDVQDSYIGEFFLLHVFNSLNLDF